MFCQRSAAAQARAAWNLLINANKELHVVRGRGRLGHDASQLLCARSGYRPTSLPLAQSASASAHKTLA
jgi:hypothetical protein